MKYSILLCIYLMTRHSSYFGRFANYVKKLPFLPKIIDTSRPCVTDRDCIQPYVCCQDPFYAFSSQFCCNLRQKHNFDPIYIINLLQP